MILKSNLVVDPGQSRGQSSRVGLTRINIRIKIIIIIVSKLNSKVNSRQDPSHEWG